MQKRPMRRRGEKKKPKKKTASLPAKQSSNHHLKILGEHEPMLASICPPSASVKSREGMRSHERYNKETVMVILRLLATQHTQEAAAAHVGINPATLSSWKKEHKDFEEACEAAKNVGMSMLLNEVWKGIERQPRLALDLLERRFPKDFGQVKRVDGQMNHTHAHGPSALLQTLHAERMKVDQARTTDDQSVVLDAQVVDGEQKQLHQGEKTTDGGGGGGSVPSEDRDI